MNNRGACPVIITAIVDTYAPWAAAVSRRTRPFVGDRTVRAGGGPGSGRVGTDPQARRCRRMSRARAACASSSVGRTPFSAMRSWNCCCCCWWWWYGAGVAARGASAGARCPAGWEYIRSVGRAAASAVATAYTMPWKRRKSCCRMARTQLSMCCFGWASIRAAQDPARVPGRRRRTTPGPARCAG
jgi:hypothetical protein